MSRNNLKFSISVIPLTLSHAASIVAYNGAFVVLYQLYFLGVSQE